MKKPLIGVTPLLDTELDSLWMLPGYFRLVEQAGGVPVMLPLTRDGDALARLAAGLGAVEIGVNSCHHQAIRQSAPGLTAMAVAGDGVVEAVFVPEKRFVWGIQWHPEMMPETDAPSCRIAAAFVQAAAGNG